jgi:protein-S-isoprenylcysteine O-methyltransferase
MSSENPEKDTPLPSSNEISIPEALDLYDKQYRPHQPKSLSGIAARSFLLGISLATSTLLTLYYLRPSTYTPLWRGPFFIAVLSLFHYLEFWTTAAYNTREAKISSFLLSSNGIAYQAAHGFAFFELVAEHYFFPNRWWLPPFVSLPILYTGLTFIIIGQVVRSMAMRGAGESFNHIVQSTKRSSHKLVTTGIYAYLRHPSYFGFFWWALGTQLVLGNVLGFVIYWTVLHRFFSARIKGEEEYLVGFFGEDYVKYRERTRAWIPFIR